MSWERFPNANYPEPWDEATMVKATDVATNEDGGSLTVDTVGAGQGPLHVTAADVSTDGTLRADADESDE